MKENRLVHLLQCNRLFQEVIPIHWPIQSTVEKAKKIVRMVKKKEICEPSTWKSSFDINYSLQNNWTWNTFVFILLLLIVSRSSLFANIRSSGMIRLIEWFSWIFYLSFYLAFSSASMICYREYHFIATID